MALFNRSNKNQQSVLPDEVSQYYQAQKRERTSVAIVLGLVALVVTLAIGAGLFLGGRYVYRNVVQKDNPKPADTTQPATTTPESTASNTSNGQTGESGATTFQANTSTPVATPAPASSTPSNTAVATPSTGDEPVLPHTGDEGH